MNFGFIIYIVGWILNFQGVFLLVPWVVSLIYDEKSGFAFIISSIIRTFWIPYEIYQVGLLIILYKTGNYNLLFVLFDKGQDIREEGEVPKEYKPEYPFYTSDNSLFKEPVFHHEHGLYFFIPRKIVIPWL